MTVRVLIDGFGEVDGDEDVEVIEEDGNHRELEADGQLTIRSDGPIAVTVEDVDDQDDVDDLLAEVDKAVTNLLELAERDERIAGDLGETARRLKLAALDVEAASGGSE